MIYLSNIDNVVYVEFKICLNLIKGNMNVKFNIYFVFEAKSNPI